MISKYFSRDAMKYSLFFANNSPRFRFFSQKSLKDFEKLAINDKLHEVNFDLEKHKNKRSQYFDNYMVYYSFQDAQYHKSINKRKHLRFMALYCLSLPLMQVNFHFSSFLTVGFAAWHLFYWRKHKNQIKKFVYKIEISQQFDSLKFFIANGESLNANISDLKLTFAFAHSNTKFEPEYIIGLKINGRDLIVIIDEDNCDIPNIHLFTTIFSSKIEEFSHYFVYNPEMRKKASESMNAKEISDEFETLSVFA